MSSININSQDQNFKHLHKSQLCFYTNELFHEDEIVKFEMKNRGYGSIYDADTWTLQLHKDVAKDLDNKNILCEIWFDNECMAYNNGYNKEYLMEAEIMEFVNSLPIPNQEYIKNGENYLIGSIDRDAWISERISEIC